MGRTLSCLFFLKKIFVKENIHCPCVLPSHLFPPLQLSLLHSTHFAVLHPLHNSSSASIKWKNCCSFWLSSSQLISDRTEYKSLPPKSEDQDQKGQTKQDGEGQGESADLKKVLNFAWLWNPICTVDSFFYSSCPLNTNDISKETNCLASNNEDPLLPNLNGRKTKNSDTKWWAHPSSASLWDSWQTQHSMPLLWVNWLLLIIVSTDDSVFDYCIFYCL